jgi:hypothetical protein
MSTYTAPVPLRSTTTMFNLDYAPSAFPAVPGFHSSSWALQDSHSPTLSRTLTVPSDLVHTLSHTTPFPLSLHFAPLLPNITALPLPLFLSTLNPSAYYLHHSHHKSFPAVTPKLARQHVSEWEIISIDLNSFISFFQIPVIVYMFSALSRPCRRCSQRLLNATTDRGCL